MKNTPAGFHTFYVVRTFDYPCWESSPCSKIGPGPLDPARSLPCSCVPSHANEHKMLVLRYSSDFYECRYSTSEASAKYKLSDRSAATRSARSPP